jgi:hypothetical protein
MAIKTARLRAIVGEWGAGSLAEEQNLIELLNQLKNLQPSIAEEVGEYLQLKLPMNKFMGFSQAGTLSRTGSRAPL